MAIETDGGVVVVEKFRLVAELVSRTDLAEDRLLSMLDRLTLKQSGIFNPPGPAVYPWRYNRDLSYVRRPLVLRDGATEEQYIFGLRRVYSTLNLWYGSIMSARYQLYAKSPRMKRYLGVARNRTTDRFADEVADRFTLDPMVVRRRVKKIGKTHIERSRGQSLGDVDVLVLDPRCRTIYALEAKDFEVARTPAELSNEIKQTLKGDKSTVELHGARVEWLRQHKAAVLEYCGIVEPDSGGWEVVGLIVTSTRLLGPLIQPSELPFMTIEEALAYVAARAQRVVAIAPNTQEKRAKSGKGRTKSKGRGGDGSGRRGGSRRPSRGH